MSACLNLANDLADGAYCIRRVRGGTILTCRVCRPREILGVRRKQSVPRSVWCSPEGIASRGAG